MPALDINDFKHVVVQVTNGGFIVHAWVEGDEKGDDGKLIWEWDTSVFTDSAAMAAYVKRVSEALEGPGEPIEIPSQRQA